MVYIRQGLYVDYDFDQAGSDDYGPYLSVGKHLGITTHLIYMLKFDYLDNFQSLFNPDILLIIRAHESN